VNTGHYWFSTHYGLNSAFCYTPPAGASFGRMKLESAKQPSRVFFISDVSDAGVAMCKYPGLGWNTLSLRHGKYDRCNMTWADGHVEPLEARDYSFECWNDAD
jgi:prepilin-type processing-associated H-X9-DG protein